MPGKLTINRVRNCKDLTIQMDNTTIVGNYDDLDINDIDGCANTRISMQNLQVVQAGAASSSHRPSGTGNMTVNHVANSSRTDINQDRMSVSGRYGNVRINDIHGSTGTSISMRGAEMDVQEGSGSDHDDDGDDNDDHQEDEEDNLDENGNPKPSTYEYYIAPKYTLHIQIGQGANVTCTFLQRERVKSVLNFIKELQPRYRNKHITLVDVKEDKFVGNDCEARLIEAGFRDKIELRTEVVEDRPTSDVHADKA